MPRIKYKDIEISQGRLDTIGRANGIIAEYGAQGFDLTLRQLYYQFVSRGLIANSQKEYSRLGDIINDARLAGLVDWDSITDRTRNLRSLATWGDPSDVVSACAQQFKIDMWARQPNRIEVWIEKDALVGVIEDVCNEMRVPFFSCRGYTSQSEMWAASQRLIRHERRGQEAIILHLGDHDPSGIDMSRDIQDRLELFTGGRVEFERLALNMDQVRRYNPPPNPAKLTDSRCQGYIAVHGNESWELDALEPSVIVDLVRVAVTARKDEARWGEDKDEEERHRMSLARASLRWSDVVEFLDLNAE